MKDQLPVKIPQIGRPKSRTKAAPYALALAAIGTGVFAGLSSGRTAHEQQVDALPQLPRAPAAVSVPAPLPAIQPAAVAPPPIAIPMTSAPTPAPEVAPAQKSVEIVQPAAPQPDNKKVERVDKAKERLQSPALIVDLGPTVSGDDARPQLHPAAYSPRQRLPLFAAAYGDQAPAPAAAAPTTPIPTVTVPDPTGAAIAAAGPAADAAATGSDPAARDLNANERFSARASNRETEVAHAERLPNQESLVVQGTLIAGVMETALNSDLPGYARAIVTRDVLSFDGSQVLIPAGSRVIGEYNSGVSQGASRIFIVWNRLIRPDGVSVSLGSPAIDDLGRGGLGGKVNRHFLQRFGGAILLSVLGSGSNLLTQSLNRNSTVIVSSNSEASSLGGGLARPNDIAPTITTSQGAAVQIFVARDLDFSRVGPAT